MRQENTFTNVLLVILIIAVPVAAALYFTRPAADQVPTDLAAAADPAAWGGAYPNQYSDFLRTSEMEETKYGGSVPYDYLEAYPYLLTIYEGYPFAEEYNRARGHYHALEDVLNTRRGTPGEATCFTCKTSDLAYLLDTMGEDFWGTPTADVVDQINHSVSCLDCHDPGTMERRPVRAYVTESLVAAGVDDEDINNIVCAQCHVEYYFAPGVVVELPWDRGFSPGDMADYFDEYGFADWTHPRTGTPLIKIQHPEYEMTRGSLHDQVGATCVSCHMPPAQGEDGETYPSHWFTSPFKQLEGACGSCHGTNPDTLQTLRSAFEEDQRVVYERTDELGYRLAEAIEALATAVEADTPEEVLQEARNLHRRAQLYWDYVFVENSNGAHNAPKALTILDEAEEMINKLLELVGG